MEVFRKTILNIPTNFQNNVYFEQSENIVENTYITFLNAMLITSSKYDPQMINICETVRYFSMYIICYVFYVNIALSLHFSIMG